MKWLIYIFLIAIGILSSFAVYNAKEKTQKRIYLGISIIIWNLVIFVVSRLNLI